MRILFVCMGNICRSPTAEGVFREIVRTRRDAKAFSFIELNDGSCLKGLQIIQNNR